jgi:hypothetical protein
MGDLVAQILSPDWSDAIGKALLVFLALVVIGAFVCR